MALPKRTKKKTVRARRRGSEWDNMPTKTWHGAHYYVHYEIESKSWGNKCREWFKANLDKKTIAKINKLPNWKVDGKSHYALAAHCEMHHPELIHKSYVGAMQRWADELAAEGELVVEEKKAEEKKKDVYVPTIQERITEQSWNLAEDIDEWLEGFVSDKDNFDPKGFDFKKHFAGKKITQAHARKMKTFFANELADFDELERMPTAGQLKKMDEVEADQWAQLKEGYSHLKKRDIKKYRDAIGNLMTALDFIIDSAKATRKPRKPKVYSADKLVSKLKFCVTDEKFKLASISPTEIIGANELWVFNRKTRKIGKYIAANPDPTGMGRDGSGLQVKGTTVTGFIEAESIQKTLRKPEEQLKEFKAAGKVKLRKYLDDIKTTDTKLNGRINPDTILLKVIAK